jgi:hypothetical protein
MRKRLLHLLVPAALAISLFAGCSDRGSNAPDPVAIDEGGPLVLNHVFFDEFLLQIRNPFQLAGVVAYIPHDYIPSIDPSNQGDNPPLPLLVLLPPQFGDEYYYFHNGLKEIADELIATGQIEPMMIVTLGNDRVFTGGFYYAGNFVYGDNIFVPDPGNPSEMIYAGTQMYGVGIGAGAWDQLVGNSLLDYLYSRVNFLDTDQQQTGIGGFGQGAYGAFRAAILNPGTFGSISAVDGPLDFDGADGNSGLKSLFAGAMTEQGAIASFTDWDTTGKPISTMLTGAAQAFSPHDTALVVYTSLSQQLVLNIEVRRNLGENLVIDDPATLADGLLTTSENDLHFHLPFTIDGNESPAVWPLWKANDLEVLLQNVLQNDPTALTDTRMWLGASNENKFGYGAMTMSFANTLSGLGLGGQVDEVRQFTGSSGHPATDHQYVYDLIKDMLIFHSKAFQGQN